MSLSKRANAARGRYARRQRRIDWAIWIALIALIGAALAKAWGLW